MSTEKTKQAIEVMQAWLDGEEIESRSYHAGDWYKSVGQEWDFKRFEYRIKPKPREWWACWNKPGGNDWTDVTLFPSPDYEERHVDHWRNRIKVREVLE